MDCVPPTAYIIQTKGNACSPLCLTQKGYQTVAVLKTQLASQYATPADQRSAVILGGVWQLNFCLALCFTWSRDSSSGNCCHSFPAFSSGGPCISAEVVASEYHTKSGLRLASMSSRIWERRKDKLAVSLHWIRNSTTSFSVWVSRKINL